METVETGSDTQSSANTVEETTAPDATISTEATTEATTTESEPWFNVINDEALRSDPNIQMYKTADDMAKSLLSAQSMIGADKIAIPTSNSGDEAWNDVYTKLGKPAAFEDYKFEGDNGAEADPTTVNYMAPVIHEAGLNQRQTEVLNKGWNALAEHQNNEMQIAYDKHEADNVSALKSVYGENLDDAVNKAKGVLKQFANDSLLERVNDENTGFGNDADLIQFLNNVAESMSEDSLNIEGGGGIRTADVIKSEIETIQKDKNGPYWNEKHPLHKTEVARVSKYYEELERFK